MALEWQLGHLPMKTFGSLPMQSKHPILYCTDCQLLHFQGEPSEVKQQGLPVRASGWCFWFHALSCVAGFTSGLCVVVGMCACEGGKGVH